jgi:uncharacterized membrane protein
MTTITYGAGTPAVAATAPAKRATAPFWERVWNAFVEARMRQAMHEISVYRHLLPGELEDLLRRNQPKINP